MHVRQGKRRDFIFRETTHAGVPLHLLLRNAIKERQDERNTESHLND